MLPALPCPLPSPSPALQFTYTTFTTVGFGDIHAITNREKIANIVMMIVGTAVFGHVVGAVSHLASIAASEGLEAKSTLKVKTIKDYLVREKGGGGGVARLLCGPAFVA